MGISSRHWNSEVKRYGIWYRATYRNHRRKRIQQSDPKNQRKIETARIGDESPHEKIWWEFGFSWFLAGQERDIEKTYDLLQDLKEYGIYHPEVDKKEAVVLYNLDRLDEAWDIISNIDPKYNEVVEADLLKGMILADKGQNEEAKQYYKTV